MKSKEQDKLAKELTKSIGDTVQSTTELVSEVVALVEQVKTRFTTLSGEDKQAIAVKVISAKIDIPFPLSLFKGFAIKMLINWTVSALNNAKGKNWSKK